MLNCLREVYLKKNTESYKGLLGANEYDIFDFAHIIIVTVI